MAYRIALALVLLIAASGCSSIEKWRDSAAPKSRTVESASAGATGPVPKIAARRQVTEVDCTKPVDVSYSGNLRCK
jgi:hypothetical protein